MNRHFLEAHDLPLNLKPCIWGGIKLISLNQLDLSPSCHLGLTVKLYPEQKHNEFRLT